MRRLRGVKAALSAGARAAASSKRNPWVACGVDNVLLALDALDRGEVDRARHHLEAEMQRRDLLRSVPVLAFLPVGDLADRINSAHTTDRALVEAYEAVLAEASRSYPRPGLSGMYRPLSGVVDRMTERLRMPVAAGLRGRLVRVIGEAAVLAGWSALVIGRRDDSRRYFSLAGTVALEANDRSILPQAYEGLATVAAPTRSADRSALSFTRQAVDAVDASTPAVVARYVTGRLAYQQAMEHQQWRPTMEAALAAGGPQPTTGLYDVDGFFGHGGDALVETRARLDDDVDTLGDLLAAETQPRRRAYLMTDVGRITGDRDLLTEAAALSGAAGSSLGVKRAEEALQLLA